MAMAMLHSAARPPIRAGTFPSVVARQKAQRWEPAEVLRPQSVSGQAGNAPPWLPIAPRPVPHREDVRRMKSGDVVDPGPDPAGAADS